jgi:L,D-peptidoglycan transpeptidase YkuD (ErfK/YbiS/YcfS/YnhG family)
VRYLGLLIVAAITSWGSFVEAISGDRGAAVDQVAERSVQFDVDADCDLTTVERLASRHAEVRQFVVMANDGWSATTGTVFVAARDRDGTWRCQTDRLTGAFGRSGTRPLLDRVSGDGTTPAGVFPLGVVTAWDGELFSMFGNSADPGALAPYRDVRPEDCWGATKHTSSYQHLVNRPGCPGPDDEWLPAFGDAYTHAAVIGANLDPISGDEPGETPYAAAIFLHRHSYRNGAPKPTSGCVSLGYDDLVRTIRLIDPALDPQFAIGPTEWLRTSA